MSREDAQVTVRTGANYNDEIPCIGMDQVLIQGFFCAFICKKRC